MMFKALGVKAIELDGAISVLTLVQQLSSHTDYFRANV